MPAGLRRSLYLCTLGLVATGILYAVPRYADLYLERDWPAVAPLGTIMKVHGAFAFWSLLLLGGIWQVHVRARIRRPANRATGLAVLALMAFLVASGFLLYYIGSRDLREWSGLTHTAAGIAVAALVVWHVRRGNRIAASRRQYPPLGPR